ncbi:peptidase M24, structural domain-containing protein [Chaetomium strumarium]|uniref:Xaa-Pro aminopeptidase n=1 Tax=Chaetomium strumarium TaxID=1170767 RepID=A0AAJ0LYC1_9PEZI|nr:peptidase M24, structural domain-containing protein [Chaetomium strumarium]
MEVDHDLVVIDEFDALSIEVKPLRQSTTEETPRPCSQTSSLNQEFAKFPAKTHARKVAKELGVTDGMIYLAGQKEQLYEDSDIGPAFRQRRHFYYITGADFPGCAVTYDIGRDYLILWIPWTDPRTVLWYGRTPTREQCLASSDVDDVRYISALKETLCASLSPESTLYVLREDQALPLGHCRKTVHLSPTKLAPAIERARVIKTDYEIAMIRRANAVSSAAHKLVLRRLKHINNECGIESVFLGCCIFQGAKSQAYPVIAASGINGSTLHYKDNNQPLKGRQLVVLDAAAEWKCYASDITRTFPISGTFSPEAAAIYKIVEAMQSECIRGVRPGVKFYKLHLTACAIAVDRLINLGILHGGSADEIMRRGTVAAFFPHGLGHHVGLEVHDVSGRDRLLFSAPLVSENTFKNGGKLSPKRGWVSADMLALLYHGDTEKSAYEQTGRQSLEPNMVVTIEPGIYFCREYIQGRFLNDPTHAKYINTSVLERYWDVGGVRIEDDILVTKDGYENLTSAPKGEEMLRIIREARG